MNYKSLLKRIDKIQAELCDLRTLIINDLKSEGEFNVGEMYKMINEQRVLGKDTND